MGQSEMDSSKISMSVIPSSLMAFKLLVLITNNLEIDWE